MADHHGHSTTIEAPVDPIAHHFNDAHQQHDSAELGMWCFLVTEVMFFGGIFLGYFLYRAAYPEAFHAASKTTDVFLGTINTAVLLTSSLTMAMAVQAAQFRDRRKLVMFLSITLVLGSIFLGVKGYEYWHKYDHHHIPFQDLPFDPNLPTESKMYFVLYFASTGLHAVHMIIGMVILAIMAVTTWRGWAALRATRVEMMGLYWHFVDIVWIFLFPFLYLIDHEHVAAAFRFGSGGGH